MLFMTNKDDYNKYRGMGNRQKNTEDQLNGGTQW